MYYVYILRSRQNGIHYYGYTSNLQTRLAQHNSGLSGYTKRYLPWELIYSECFGTRSEAMKREKYFKTGAGHAFLKSHGII